MRHISRFLMICGLGLSLTFGGFGCIGTGSGGETVIFIPTWIVAIWSGGAMGPPNDRTDTEATDFEGTICPASAVELTNHDGTFAGLCIFNNCTQLITMALCLAAGSLPQPDLGMSECAVDPFDTDFSQLTIVPLNPGTEGFCINATEALDVNIFFCSDSQTLAGPPLFDTIQCI